MGLGMKTIVSTITLAVALALSSSPAQALNPHLKLCDSNNKLVGAFYQEGSSQKFSLVIIPSGQVIKGFSKEPTQNAECIGATSPFPVANRYMYESKMVFDACVFKNQISTYLFSAGTLSTYDLKNCDMQ